jgi:biopolymer transport protein ExbB
MEVLEPIARFFDHGGLFMYPIALALAAVLAVAVERSLFLWRAGRSNRSLWQRVGPQLAAGDLAAAEASVRSSDAALAQVIGAGIARAYRDARRSEVEHAAEQGLMEVLPALERRTPYLAMLSNLATLLGLLGTVVGLIGAFSALAGADSPNKAELLSGSISEAMNCTAFGLTVAIPALVAHALLQSRTARLVEALEAACARFVDSVSQTQVAP